MPLCLTWSVLLREQEAHLPSLYAQTSSSNLRTYRLSCSQPRACLTLDSPATFRPSASAAPDFPSHLPCAITCTPQVTATSRLSPSGLGASPKPDPHSPVPVINLLPQLQIHPYSLLCANGSDPFRSIGMKLSLVCRHLHKHW